MGEQNRNKLNRLISEWPIGVAYTASYLGLKGYSRGLLSKYKKSRWIKPIGKGVYVLYNDNVDWMGALHTLQRQLDLKVHPGGKTALEIKGYAHFLSPNEKKVYLYVSGYPNLPAWFVDNDWGYEIKTSKTKMFPEGLTEGLTDIEVKDFSIKTSTPERAALEMLYHVPDQITFDEAFLIMENLTTLRPNVVQLLLEKCKFIKVKRLFMYMAEECGHQWASQIDTSKINFGNGKRLIVRNGMLDKKYLITVPHRER